MRTNSIFVRNIAAEELLDIFIVSAASSIILLRFWLHITDYPFIGGGKYHIAHMLWGGLLMLVAFVLNFAFLGGRVQRLVSLTGGVGFGVFIDEVGKFVTRDNDYFFQPAIGIIYAVFVVLYLTSSFLSRQRKLTETECYLNSLRALEEVVRNDMDLYERQTAEKLLLQTRQNSPLTKALQRSLREAPLTKTPQPGRFTRLGRDVARRYRSLWQNQNTGRMLTLLFIGEAFLYISAFTAVLYANLDMVYDFFVGEGSYGFVLVIGQLASSILAGLSVLYGATFLPRSRLRAFEWFRRATLINLLLTEFFVFSRIEFQAMPGFIFNLILLVLLNFAIGQERQILVSRSSTAKVRATSLP